MKQKLLKLLPVLFITAFVPFVVFAQNSAPTGIASIIIKIQDILDQILPVLISFGVVYFIWGIVSYVIADGEEAKKTGKERMIYGVIGFAVIIGMWGLVAIITTTFGLEGSAPALDTVVSTTTCVVPSSSSNFQGVISYIICLISGSVIPLIFGFATVMFIWGAVKFFIINADEEAKRNEGKQFMIWGIIALAVMLSVWGLVGILGSTFGIKGSVFPSVKPPGSSVSP